MDHYKLFKEVEKWNLQFTSPIRKWNLLPNPGYTVRQKFPWMAKKWKNRVIIDAAEQRRNHSSNMEVLKGTPARHLIQKCPYSRSKCWESTFNNPVKSLFPERSPCPFGDLQNFAYYHDKDTDSVGYRVLEFQMKALVDFVYYWRTMNSACYCQLLDKLNARIWTEYDFS